MHEHRRIIVAVILPSDFPITPPSLALLPVLKRTAAMVSSKGKPTDPKMREEIKESEWPRSMGTIVLYQQYQRRECRRAISRLTADRGEGRHEQGRVGQRPMVGMEGEQGVHRYRGIG
jgi:hypothetical protein